MKEYVVNKPVTMTLKDWLIRRMSTEMMLSESIIHRVVDHQMSGVRKALESNDTVEVSGFGKFIFNRKKAHVKLEKLFTIKGHYDKILNDPDSTERQKASTDFKLHKLLLDIEALKKRL